MNKVLVVGSINMDLVVQTPRFPGPGETLLGRDFRTLPGGKGANQAVAAKRLGAEVRLLGCVGKDVFGTELLKNLQTEGVDTQHVRIAADTATGVASIAVCQAENAITVAPGANFELSPGDIHRAASAFIWADVVLAQLETPLETIEAAAMLAKQHGKPFLLNPAPAMPLPAQLLGNTTLLIPNEHELSIVMSAQPDTWKTQLQIYPGRIVMTKGADGAWFTDATGILYHQPGFSVQAVDTTGAGDTFNAALAAFWGQGMAETVRQACAAGALSVTRAGAQGGMPTREQLDHFLTTQESNNRPKQPD